MVGESKYLCRIRGHQVRCCVYVSIRNIQRVDFLRRGSICRFWLRYVCIDFNCFVGFSKKSDGSGGLGEVADHSLAGS